MAEICCGVVSESEVTKAPCDRSSRVARKRRMDIRRFKYVAEVPSSEMYDEAKKRLKMANRTASLPANCVGEYGEGSAIKNEESIIEKFESGETKDEIAVPAPSLKMLLDRSSSASVNVDSDIFSKYGVSSVCGRRRDMEDTVTVRPSLLTKDLKPFSDWHYFAVFDGHGCSHVAARCRDRMHELVREELLEMTVQGEISAEQWRSAMVKSFSRMDKEVTARNEGVFCAPCKCDMQLPECDAVGSTALVAIITPTKIIVANCGDSRAVLCRNGKPVSLSTDHKPDLPGELSRIEAAGGRVLYWDCPRVLGVLAMSRSIGDNYLKPCVSCEPEVTITERRAGVECLILGSDGLWDVVPNDMACGVARLCLKEKAAKLAAKLCGGEAADIETAVGEIESGGNKACTDASMMLMKLAVARLSSDNISVVVVDLRKDT